MEPSFSLNLQQYQQDSFLSINDRLIDDTSTLVMNYIDSIDTSSSSNYNSYWSSELLKENFTFNKSTRPMSYAGMNHLNKCFIYTLFAI
jgi:hypothetical protein